MKRQAIIMSSGQNVGGRKVKDKVRWKQLISQEADCLQRGMGQLVPRQVEAGTSGKSRRTTIHWNV